ncbi:MAG TPA: phosphatidylserine synthase [Leptospiraceae bacterium]|nr:phosphatidylserine synthase [Spirochaetaceae bacterium]HBS04823.1 phosphatidylserine synthase [Leptospiraceae bacterium]
MELLLSEKIYSAFQQDLLQARRFVWIATADLKSTFIESGGKFRSILEVFADLVRNGVEIRLIHAKEPGILFRKEFDRFPALVESDRFERFLCPRNHSKCVIVDGKSAIVGSANLTGAGMGAKGIHKRNFEMAYRTTDARDIQTMMDQLDALCLGDFCQACKLRSACPDPIA